MNKLLTLVLAAAALSPAARADDAHHTSIAAATAPASASTTGFAANEGEVRKIDKVQGKLTVKHGPLPNVEMPAMTMVFRVKDPAMLDRISAGDRVKLQVKKENGALVVTEMSKL